MARHGITSETVKRMLIDAGAVYVNYGESDERLLGATQGGNVFTVEREIKQVEIDGAIGPVKGARRVISEKAILTVNLLEHSAENWKLILTAADMSDVMDETGVNKIADEIRTRQILDSDYVKNIALVGELSGTSEPVVIILENALSEGEVELSMEHTGEAVPEVVFAAHWDPADMGKSPYAIRFPVVE